MQDGIFLGFVCDYRQSLYHCKKNWIESIWQIEWCADKCTNSTALQPHWGERKSQYFRSRGLFLCLFSRYSFWQVQSISLGTWGQRGGSIYAQRSRAIVAQSSGAVLSANYRRPYEIEEVDNANVMMRAEALKWCSHAKQPIVLVNIPMVVQSSQKRAWKKPWRSKLVKV